MYAPSAQPIWNSPRYPLYISSGGSQESIRIQRQSEATGWKPGRCAYCRIHHTEKNYIVKRVMIFLMLHSIIIRPQNNYSILDYINYNYNFNTWNVVFHAYANNRRGSTNKQNHIVTAGRSPNHSSVNPRTKSRGGLPQFSVVSSSNITLDNCTQNPRPCWS